MKNTLIFACTLAVVTGCGRVGSDQKTLRPAASSTPSPNPAVTAEKTNWKTVEEFDYTWNPAQAPVHFKLELPEGYRDPGDFTRIHIQAKGQPELVLDNGDGWVEYNSQEQPSTIYKRLKTKSLVQSKYVLILPASRRKGDPPLVLLRSWGYASDADRLHVIGFQSTGKPTLLLNDELDLIELADLDGDGYAEIAGRPCLSQAFGPGLLTYDPFHVYKIPRPITGPAILSVPLSKRYNMQHYYGWAGPDCSERLAVVLHPPGGGNPLIMPADKAEKLMERAK